MRRQTKTFAILGIAGIILMPVLVYAVGRAFAGPYEGEGGLAGFLLSIYAGLGQGSLAAWILTLAPALLAGSWWLATELLGAISRSTRPVNPGDKQEPEP